MDSSDIKWEKPGNRSNARTDWDGIADALRERSGEWAVVGEGLDANTTQSIKTGRLRAFRPAGSFEAASRGVVGGKAAKIYARHVGEKSDR